MSAQDQINAWGRAKYPDAPKGNFAIEVEDLGPGCSTCGYGGGMAVKIRVGYKEVAELGDQSIQALMVEIMEHGK